MSAPPRALLAVDLDGTMVGDSAALRRLNAALAGARERVLLAYMTGRTFASAQALIAEAELLRPDVLVTDVGAAIHAGPGLAPDAGWGRRMARRWSAARIRAIAGFFPAIVPQPPAHQGPFRCSYTLSAEAAPQTLPLLSDALRRQRLGCKLIYSSGRDLDIVPTGADKGQALRYVARHLGLASTHVLACGDSGNDYAMLTAGCLSAVVANAQPELATLPETVYRARGAYAAGVHEALLAHGWL